jgi:hypothetical protein
VKEFIEPQLRAAKEKDLKAAFDLTFDDSDVSARPADPNRRAPIVTHPATI